MLSTTAPKESYEMNEKQRIVNHYAHIFTCDRDGKDVDPPPISRGPVPMVDITCRACGNNAPVRQQTLGEYLREPERIRGILGGRFRVVNRYCN